MDKGVYYNIRDEQHTLKLVGELRFKDSHPLVSMLSSFEHDSELGALKLDLYKTDYLDSTMLGVIGELGFIFMQRSNSKPVIYCQENDIKKMIDTMGLTQLFEMKHVPCPQAELEVLPNLKGEQNYKDIIIQAHEMLIKIDSSNKSEFEDLLRQLKPKDMNGDE
jgi:anti-anti-sigma regulatory factor